MIGKCPGVWGRECQVGGTAGVKALGQDGAGPWGREPADVWRGACWPHRPVLLPLPCSAAARPWGSRWGLAGRVQPDGRWMGLPTSSYFWPRSSCISPSIPHKGLPVSTLFPQDWPGRDSGSRSSICWTSGRPAPACPDSAGNEHAQSPGPRRLHAKHESHGTGAGRGGSALCRHNPGKTRSPWAQMALTP